VVPSAPVAAVVVWFQSQSDCRCSTVFILLVKKRTAATNVVEAITVMKEVNEVRVVSYRVR